MPRISPKLNFTPNNLGCCGLKVIPYLPKLCSLCLVGGIQKGGTQKGGTFLSNWRCEVADCSCTKRHLLFSEGPFYLDGGSCAGGLPKGLPRHEHPKADNGRAINYAGSGRLGRLDGPRPFENLWVEVLCCPPPQLRIHSTKWPERSANWRFFGKGQKIVCFERGGGCRHANENILV